MTLKKTCDNCKYSIDDCYASIGTCNNYEKFVSKNDTPQDKTPIRLCASCIDNGILKKGDYGTFCQKGMYYQSVYNDNINKEYIQSDYDDRKQQNKCRYYTNINNTNINNTHTNKKEEIPKMEEISEKEQIKSEIKRVEDEINKMKIERYNRISKTGFNDLIYDTNYGNIKFKSDFKQYIKEADKKLYKKIKKFKFKCWATGSTLREKLSKLEKDDWDKFSQILKIVEDYNSKFKLHKSKKKLCYYTDCYNKLATEKTCVECGSVNDIRAMFCNQCGFKF